MRPLAMVVLTPLVVGMIACASSGGVRQAPRRHDASLITRDEIMRSGATDAWDALHRVGSFLNLTERRGQIAATYRGRASLLVNPEVLVVIDDVMMLDLASLREVQADSIAWIRVMSGAEGTPLYGSAGGNGVIVVRTRLPDRR